MFRRGLPAALFATLALGGVYWMLRARTGPAKSPTAAADVSSSESVHAAGVRPAALEKAADNNRAAEDPAQRVVEEPVVRALRPTPQPEAAPAPEQPGPEAQRPPEPRVNPGTTERAKAPAPKAVKPSAGGTGKAPAAARADSAAEPRDAKSTRPNFLNKLEEQDYGGRE